MSMDEIKALLKQRLTPKRYAHSLGVDVYKRQWKNSVKTRPERPAAVINQTQIISRREREATCLFLIK